MEALGGVRRRDLSVGSQGRQGLLGEGSEEMSVVCRGGEPGGSGPLLAAGSALETQGHEISTFGPSTPALRPRAGPGLTHGHGVGWQRPGCAVGSRGPAWDRSVASRGC